VASSQGDDHISRPNKGRQVIDGFVKRFHSHGRTVAMAVETLEKGLVIHAVDRPLSGSVDRNNDHVIGKIE
jgi:hypothetical protein